MVSFFYPVERSIGASLVVQTVKNVPAKQENPDSIPGSGRSPGEGHGNPLQYSWTEETGGLQSMGLLKSWHSSSSS